MSEIADLLRLAESGNKNDRKEAAKSMGKMDNQTDAIMDKLQELQSDGDKGVRKEAEKAYKSLSKKPTQDASVDTEAGSSGTGFDDQVGDSSLKEGEYDLESSMSKRDEDRMESAAEGVGLNVVLLEKNSASLDFHGNVVERQPASGVVKVMNNGSRSRITGVDLELKNTSGVTSDDLNDATHISVVAPGADNAWKKEYSFDTEFSPIKVEQTYIDPDTGVSPNFVGGSEKNFDLKISITNTLDTPIYSVKGTKGINSIANASSTNASGGSVSDSGSGFEFNFEEIGAGETVEVTANLSAALPEDQQSYEAGALEVVYDVKDALTSGMDFGSINGETDIKQRVRRRQRETEPDLYDCEIQFLNKSEFIIDMKRFTVFADNMDSQSIVLDWMGESASEDEREVVPSENVSFEFAYESETTPEFGNFLEFSVQSTVSKISRNSLTLPAQALRFMAIDIIKTFISSDGEISDLEIDSYRETEVPTKLVVTGVGTFGLEAISISDEVPNGFNSPETVTVRRNDRELSAEDYNFSSSGDGVTITLENLQDTEEGAFVKDHTITLEYNSVAVNPEPREEPIQSIASAEGWLYEAPDSRVRAETEIDGLNLIVVHRRSIVDISKGTYAIDHNGSNAFEIELEAENAGTATETITVQDLIPSGFRYLDESLKMAPEGHATDPSSSENGQIHGWKFDNVGPGDMVTISFTLVQDDENASTKKLYTVYKG